MFVFNKCLTNLERLKPPLTFCNSSKEKNMKIATPHLLFLLMTCFLVPAYGQKTPEHGLPEKKWNYESFTPPASGSSEQWLRLNPGEKDNPELGVLQVYAPSKSCVEIISKRTANQKSYVDPEHPEKVFTQSGYNTLHYQKDGKWQTIDYRLQQKGGGEFEASRQEEPVGFNARGAYSYITTTGGQVKFNQWALYGSDNNGEFLLAKADWTNYTAGDDGLYVHNIFPGIDAQMRVLRGAVKTNFIVHSIAAFPNTGELIFKDVFNTTGAAGFRRENDDDKSNVLMLWQGSQNLLRMDKAVMYPEKEQDLMMATIAYKTAGNEVSFSVDTTYLNQFLSHEAVIIDPLVTASNTLAQSSITSMYNSTCSYNNYCDHRMAVTRPAGITLTDVQFTFGVLATLPCKRENAVFGFTSGGAGSCWNGFWYCIDTGAGSCAGYGVSISNLISCLAPSQCASVQDTFNMRYYRSCVGPTGCDNTCIGAAIPWTMTVVGYTVQYTNGITAYAADTACYGTSIGVKALPQYGIPPYATTNWSFSSSGTPSIGTGDSISLGVLNPGTYTVYANTTDACGTTAQTSKVITIYPIPAITKFTKANPSTCGGSDGSFTLYGLSANTNYTLNYTKNGTAAGPVTVASDASGALTVGGLSTGTYSGFNVSAHGCSSTTYATSLVLANPSASSVTVTGNPCTANVITMTANPSWAINTWQFNGSPVITDTIATWNATGTVVAGTTGSTGSALNQFATGPLGVSTDIYGNVYVADNNNHRIVKWQPGATTGIVVAGGNGAGSGLNQFNAPYGVYADADSNVYVADRNNSRIIKWAPGATSGVVVAGGNGAGSGLNQINNPRGVFVDGAKNVYVADLPNNRIMKWAPGATTGTVAAGGNGAGAALNQLSSPTNVYVDAAGTMYIADYGNNRILKWLAGATSGTVVAGGNGAGNAANQFSGPRGIKVDAFGFLYVADQNNNRVQRWAQGAANGITVAGGNNAGTALNQVNNPVDLGLGTDGSVYPLEQNNVRVTKFTPKATDTLIGGVSGTYTANVTSFNGCTSTGSMSWTQKDTVTITANPGSIVCTGTSVTFSATVKHGGTSPVYTWKRNGTVVGTNSPTYTTTALSDRDVISCTFSSTNPCTVSDSIVMRVNALPVVTLTGNPCTANMIIMNSSTSWYLDTWKNNGTAIVTDTNKWNSFATVAAGGNGAGSALNQVNFPLGVAADAAGNTYVADAQNHRIVKWAPGATSGTVVAGGNGAGSAANQLSFPFAVAVDADTNVYVMEWGNARVSKWAYGATSGVTVAGGNGNGSGLNQLNAAQGLFVDANKNVYVSDNSNARVVKWTPGATTGVIVAGGNGAGSGLNQLSNPVSVYVDGANNLFISDYNNARIMKWAPGATSGTVVAGGNGAGSAANQFSGPRCSWQDGMGNIYVCDQGNNRVQMWAQGATTGKTVAGGNGAGTGLNQLNSPTSIYVSAIGEIYTVEQNNNRALKFSPKTADTLIPTNTATYTATVTDFNGCVNTGSMNWIQADTISITANPGYEVCAGSSVTFTATILHPGTSPVYTWKKNGTVVGSNSATYTATSLNDNDRISCTFTSSSCTVTDSVVMKVNPMPNVSISGTPCTGQKLTLNTAVTSLQTKWTLNGNPLQTYDAAWQPNGTVVAGGNGAGAALNQLNNPSSVYADASGNVIIADEVNYRVMMWAPAATTGVVVAGGNGYGTALNQFAWNNGVMPGYNAGEMYISDANNNRVAKWLQGGTTGTVAAGGNGIGAAANQIRPYNAALDGYGNIFAGDANSTSPGVRKWKLGYSSGLGVAGYNGVGSAANQFSTPYSIFLDNNATDVYVSDYSNNRVMKWTAGNTTGTVVAGGNGAGSAANQVNGAAGIFLDGLKNVYVADGGNNRIQRWAQGATSGSTIIGGNGAGTALNQLNGPDGIYMDKNGNVYVADNGNARIMKFQSYNTDSLMPATAGTYKVIVTTFKGCRDSASYTVNLTPTITSKASVNPTTCAGANGSITLNGLTASTTFSVTYKKNGTTVGPVNMTSNASGSIVIGSLSSGAYNNFSITATSGCISPADTATINLVDPNPPAAPSASSNTPLCAGQTLNLNTPAATGVTYSWTGPNSFTSNSQTPSITNVTTAASGTYSVTTTNTTTGCTSAAGTTTVLVKPLPVVPTIGSNSPVCTGQTINLTASTTTSGATYSWSGPNSFATTTQNPSITSATTAAAGTYSVVSLLNGCQSATTATVNVSVNVTPVILSNSFSNPTTCSGTDGNIVLNGMAASTQYTINYSKNAAAPTSVNLTSTTTGVITIPNLGAGTYTNITVGSGAGCTSAPVASITLTDPALPATPTVGSNTPVCAGQSLNLTANSTSTGIAYSWTGPNSFASTTQNPTIAAVTAAAAGTYTVTVTNTTTLCTSAPATTTVVINPLPIDPTAGSNSPVCQGGTLNLTSTATTSGATYNWSGPNSFTSTAQNPTISPVTLAANGTYTVYTLLNGCQSANSSTVTVTVKPLPAVPSISSNSPVCSGTGNTLQLNAASTTTGVSYGWTGPNSFTSSAQNPSITAPTVTATGLYTVTVTLNGCTVNASTNVVVNQTPSAPTVANLSYCQYEPSVALTATGANLKWYTTSGSTTPLSAAPIPATLTPGTYTWYVSQSDGVTGCESQRSTITVTIKQKPAAPTGGNSYVYCQFEPTQPLTVSGQNLLWYTAAAGGLGNPAAPAPNTTVPGTYGIWVSQTVNGCESDRFAIAITVKEKPAPPVVVTPIYYCQYGTAVPLTATGQNLKWYTTATGGVGASVAPVPNTGYPDTVAYYVTQTINGCESDRKLLNVITHYQPNGIVLASKTYVCQHDTISFNYFGNALPNALYDWKAPLGAAQIVSGSGAGPIVVRFDSTGTYQMRMQVEDHGCVSKETFYDVTVRPAPMVRPVVPSDVCANETAQIMLNYATAGIDTYNWNFDGGVVKYGDGASTMGVAWSNPGTHLVTLIVKAANCPSQESVDTVQVHELPFAKITNAPSGKICADDSLEFTGNDVDSGSVYTWLPVGYFGDFSHAGPTTIGRVIRPGYITLQVTTPWGCRGADSVYVDAQPCCEAYLPDAFTPNNDGRNDVFRVITDGNHQITTFRILNRWGQVVFETANEKVGWDGTFGGTQQEMGTYYYYLKYRCVNGTEIEKKGEVTLIR